MLDLIAHGAEGHGPVHLLGLPLMGCEQGWIRVALPPLRVLSGSVQHFQSAVLQAAQG